MCTRMLRLLSCVHFGAVFELYLLFVSHIPDSAKSLYVLRCTEQIAGEFEKYYSKLVDMLARIGDVLPTFTTYERLYGNHERLLNALSTVYLDILTFCTDAKRVFQEGRKQRSTGNSQALRYTNFGYGLLTSFRATQVPFVQTALEVI
jgi:hypothetical protein